MRGRDAGYTLVELLVALALLLLALAMFASAFVVVQRTSAQQLERGWTTNQIRQAMVALDAQMRSGYVAKLQSAAGYEEIVIYTEAGVVPARTCAGWRLTKTDPQKLYAASWPAGGAAPTFPAAWSLMASGIRNSVAAPGTSAFTTQLYPSPSDPLAVGISLGVDLWVDTTGGASQAQLLAGKGTRIMSTFTTRNIRRYDTVVPALGVAPREAC